MLSLYLDTSGPHCTVVVSRSRIILAASTTQGRPAQHVHEQIRRTLASANVPASALDRIGVVTGPGSWTGLNIGVTAAKVLAQVLQAGLVTVPALDALARSTTWTRGTICAVMDAGRGRLCRAWYTADNTGLAMLPSMDMRVLTGAAVAEEFAQAADEPLVVACGTAVAPEFSGNLVHVEQLSPKAIIGIGEVQKPLSISEGLALSPYYMQPTMAERDAAQ